jgi:hypothetical protein
VDALQDSTSIALQNYLLAHLVRFHISSFNFLRQLIANTPSTPLHLQTTLNSRAPIQSLGSPGLL